jgi:hypothetical protein
VAIPPAAPSAWPAMVARLPFGAGARAWLPVATTVDGPAAPAGRRETLSTVPAGGGRPVARAGETTTRPKPHAASKRRPAPRWRPAPLQRPAAAPVPTASAAGVAGGGSSGSGLPFLLALPFVAALLDLARRVAFERATWPTGHRRRAPDRPG